MIVRGRDKPTVQIRFLDDGTVAFRVDFELRPDAWVEIELTPTELGAMAESKPLEKP